MSNVEPSASLGQSVRQRRLAAGLTQSELAETADVADATLSRIERDQLEPSIGLVQRITASRRATLRGQRGAERNEVERVEVIQLGGVTGGSTSLTETTLPSHEIVVH